MPLRAILSDLDGTLVDSTPAVLRTWTSWRRDRGLEESMEAHPHGVPAKQVVQRIAPHLDADAEAAELERREIADVDGVVALPGALELLSSPPAGVAVAIVTSCTAPLARARLRAAGLPEAPGTLVTAERTERVKPDPDPFLLAARELGVDPADCVVLEDAPAGVAAARAAGMRVVAVRTTHGDAELTEADEVVDDPAAFLAGLR